MSPRTVIIIGGSDIFFRAKLEQLTKAKGGQPIFVSSIDELRSAMREKRDASTLIVVDLEKGSIELDQIVSTSDGAELVGFYPHVKRELFEGAKSSGLKKIVPRSGIEAVVSRFLER